LQLIIDRTAPIFRAAKVHIHIIINNSRRVIIVFKAHMKQFDVPEFYRSEIIGRIKNARKAKDPMKKDVTPTTLDFGNVRFHIARHFGFCYGVENAIEISYRAIEENPDKRIFLLSQMIHNPMVNADLQDRGIKFIMDPQGNQFVPWSEITSDDIVIVPAFGTTVEIENQLEEIGIEVKKYNTTCPFVEKVWKRSSKLGNGSHTVIIHGKPDHEETRATFSHSSQNAKSLVVKNIEETTALGEIILGTRPISEFESLFGNRVSKGFDMNTDLKKIGVVNQTTMLASDTQGIADHLRDVMVEKFGEEEIKAHFADNRDTLCYATNDNQQATYGLLELEADLAIVVGGYNSSNTSHLVELCETKFPTYYINGDQEIQSKGQTWHFDMHDSERKLSDEFIPNKEVVDVILTSGASCPDAIVDSVIQKVLSYFDGHESMDSVLDSTFEKG
jgi:4-hydroxy-3-methylbut-2-enyl diphosphate reductase